MLLSRRNIPLFKRDFPDRERTMPPSTDEGGATMGAPIPENHLVQQGLESLLHDHGLYFPHAIVTAWRIFNGPRPTYIVRVNGYAKPTLLKCLEDLLGRRFRQEARYWVLEAEEAQVLAVVGGWQPDATLFGQLPD